MERRVLGKGLDALIPKKSIATLEPSSREFTYMPVSKIQPGKYQPRKEIDPRELAELSQSIKEKGFIQPIVVRRITGDRYEIVAGGRRYYAAKSLGLNEIPTIVKDLDDKDTFLLAIVENLQRKDLNPMEEAEAFARLVDEFEFTQDDIAKFIGKDKTTVANILRLFKLPEDIKEALRSGLLSRSQARTLLAVDTKEEQTRLFRQILNEGLSVREIETRAKAVSKKKKTQDPFVTEVEDKLQKLLGTKVRVSNKRNNRGRIVIEYYNLDDLERIVRRLG
ncbi:MAG: ParB/RepB/Spo0J family partition protein [Candidatus Omnitrophota bacterium]|nr:ParB/RepB/Spo0J family partition protein [Candidatus Omnitrophota bacterium]